MKHPSLNFRSQILSYLIGDQESVSSLSAVKIDELPKTFLDKISTPLTLDTYHYPVGPFNQIFNHHRQDLIYYIPPVNRINNCLHCFTFTRSQKLTRLTQTTAELKFGVTVKFIGLNLHLFPLSFQSKHLSLFSALLRLVHSVIPPTNLHLIINGKV